MYQIKILFIIILMFSMYSCGPDKKIVIIDNPTPKGLHIKFKNGYTTYVEAWGQEKIIFSNDSASVYVADTLVGDFILGKEDEYILNPTRQYYYIEQLAYGYDGRETQNRFAKNNKLIDSTKFQVKIFMVDTLAFMGYVNKVNDLLIPKEWEYSVNEYLPKWIETTNKGGELKTKIFREYEFIRFHDLINQKLKLDKTLKN